MGWMRAFQQAAIGGGGSIIQRIPGFGNRERAAIFRPMTRLWVGRRWELADSKSAAGSWGTVTRALVARCFQLGRTAAAPRDSWPSLL